MAVSIQNPMPNPPRAGLQVTITVTGTNPPVSSTISVGTNTLAQDTSPTSPCQTVVTLPGNSANKQLNVQGTDNDGSPSLKSWPILAQPYAAAAGGEETGS